MSSRNNSIDNACRILILLSEQEAGINLTQLSDRMGINKSTAYRYLSTLERYRIITKKDNRYTLGLRIFEMGNRVPVIRLILERIYPRLLELGFLFNETVSMGILSDSEVMILERIEKGRSLVNQVFTGTKVPMYCTSLGKAILSVMPPEHRDALLAEIHFEKLTPRTILTREKLLQDLEETRERGYSIDDSEYEEDLKCVGVPLFFDGLGVMSAVSVTGPRSRMKCDRARHIGEHLREAVDSFVREMNK
ncbi:MAG: IclR family transcriptional regulator [Acidobacteriota bacterium]|jgi:DNA-binding IclR family transcriptional regulator|nr:IclR family transcriptional regulator [Acidobacteriota bacterium]